MAKRIEYDRYGGPEGMRLGEVTLAEPARGQIRVLVKAASVNPIDWKVRRGELRLMTGSSFPRGMGRDFAGIVEAVGPDAKRFAVGDHVFGGMDVKKSATFGESILTAEQTASLKPPNVSFEQAATLATVGKTAWGALVDTGHLKDGDRLFVNGCLGGVGRAAVQIGRMLGAKVSGSCRGRQFAEARAMGVESVVDYRTLDPTQFRGCFDLVLDAAGKMSPAQCRLMLDPTGVAVHVPGSFSRILRIVFSRRNKVSMTQMTTQTLDKIGQAAAEGFLTVPVGKVVSLAEAIPAITTLEREGTPTGKIVVVPGEPPATETS